MDDIEHKDIQREIEQIKKLLQEKKDEDNIEPISYPKL